MGQPSSNGHKGGQIMRHHKTSGKRLDGKSQRGKRQDGKSQGSGSSPRSRRTHAVVGFPASAMLEQIASSTTGNEDMIDVAGYIFCTSGRKGNRQECRNPTSPC